MIGVCCLQDVTLRGQGARILEMKGRCELCGQEKELVVYELW